MMAERSKVRKSVSVELDGRVTPGHDDVTV